jgi:stage V sporulation protein B
MSQSRFSGAVSLFIAQAVVLLLGWITHPLIGRILGPGPYGIYGVVLSIQTIFGLFLALGVPMAISRFVAQDPQHARSILMQALRIQLIIAVLLGTITFLVSPLIARSLNDASLSSYLRFVAIVIFLQAGYPIFVQFLSGLHLFNRQALLTAFYAVTKLAGALSLILIWHVYGAFAGFAIGGLAAALLGWYWTRNIGRGDQIKLPLKSFLSFAGIYVLISVGLQLLISLDLFMVKAILKDNVIAGYYNAAVTLSRISFMLLQSLTFVLLPSVSALTKPGVDREQAAAFISDSLRYLIMLIIPGAALAAATSRSLLRLFYSAQYDQAATPLSILMVGLAAIAFFLLLANIVSGAGRAKIALFVTIIMLVLSPIFGWALIPNFGLIGAAWQTTIAGLIGLTILAVYTFRTFRLPVPYQSILRIIIASVVAVLPTYFWHVSPLFLPLQYIALLCVYLLTLFILREIKLRDRQLIASLHPHIKWLAK